jgi:twitching motility protein PilT
MSTLATLLRCLSRSDISEVRLQSDAAAAAATANGSFTALTRTPLTTAQIVRIVDGTSVAGVLTNLGSGTAAEVELVLADARYSVHLMRQDERVQLRFARAAGSVGAVAAAPHAVPAHADEPPAAATTLPPQAHAAAPGPPEVLGSAAAAPPASVVARPSAVQPVPAGVAQALVGRSPLEEALHAAEAAAAATVPAAARSSGAAVTHDFLVHILKVARAQQASDVHIVADRPLRMRRHAELVAHGDVLPRGQVDAALLALLSPGKRADLGTRGYADLALTLPEIGRLRVNVAQQATGLKACFRLVANEVPTLASLGLPKELETVSHYHQGLAVIAGPNGQGKTTTLAALVNLINGHAPHHIITVEDPVEIVHPVKRALISQREVGTHTQSFARALKAALREDPDVIVIGELRDRETVEIALTAAETGHLVIATMSTRSAAKTIDRLIDLFPPDEQQQVRATLAGALKVIVSQRLLPSVGGGMVAAAELITGSVPLWSLIRDNKLFQLGSLQQRGRSLGMIKFDTALQELVTARKITLETARRHAENLPEFERMLAGTGAPAKGA